jgi:hypothetical protein
LSSTPQSEITLTSLERAIEHCKRLEPAIEKVATVQLNHNGAARQDLAEFIRGGAAEGRSKRDVFRRLRNIKSEQEKIDIIRGLIREEVIVRFRCATATRPREDYIHSDHMQEYKNNNGSKVTQLEASDGF